MLGWKRMLSLVLALCLLPVWAMAEAPVLEYEDDALIEDVMLDEEEELWDAENESDGLFISDEIFNEINERDEEFDDTVDRGVLELNKNLPDNVINILLVGIDTRSTELDKGEQHGDVQIILSINKDTGSIKLTSIQRDLYVTLPGYKNKNRINVAYHFGQSNSKRNGSGGQFAMRTINRNFEMNLEYFATINFYGLASVVDMLGGVDMELTAEEAGAINTYLRQHPPAYDNRKGTDYKRQELERVDGVQHLDGVQAVMYARTRHTESGSNDYERTERQRKLLEVLLHDVMEDIQKKQEVEGISILDSLSNLMLSVEPYVTTNMNLWSMFTLAAGLVDSGIVEKAMNGEILMEQFRIPMDGTAGYLDVERSGKKMSVINFYDGGQKKNTQALHEFIYGKYYPAK